MHSLSVTELADWQAQQKAFLLLDVRRHQARAASGVQMARAQWKDPALWLDWKDQIASDLPVVLVCAHGHEISQGLTATLRAMGRDAHHLEGGMGAWQAQGLAVEALQEPDAPGAARDRL
jgi:rhodanese-related sulfurtransferase